MDKKTKMWLLDLCKKHGLKVNSKMTKNTLKTILHTHDIKDENIEDYKTIGDKYTLSVLNDRWNSFKKYSSECRHMCIYDIRMPNFPEDISENIVKFVLKRQDESIQWYKTGDLRSDKNGIIEVKCFSSTGPTSFGPTEKWDIIYFLDASNYDKDVFTLYKIGLSSCSSEWQGLIINAKNETYYIQCQQGRRPRLCWKDIKKQIPAEKIEIIFNDTIDKLLNNTDLIIL